VFDVALTAGRTGDTKASFEALERMKRAIPRWGIIQSILDE